MLGLEGARKLARAFPTGDYRDAVADALLTVQAEPIEYCYNRNGAELAWAEHDTRAALERLKEEGSHA